MMIACNSGLMQAVKLLRTHKSHGCAETDLTFFFHGLVSMDCLLKLLTGQCFSRCNNRETVYALILMDMAHLYDLFLRKEIIDLTVCVMMR